MRNTDLLPLNYSELIKAGTGAGVQPTNMRIVEQPIGNFVVKIALSPTNAFLGVVEVSSHSDFRSPTQRHQAPNYHDVESFYKE